jgi:hypothetical protein
MHGMNAEQKLDMTDTKGRKRHLGKGETEFGLDAWEGGLSGAEDGENIRVKKEP